MYYLNFSELYKYTDSDSRRAVRKEMTKIKRDEIILNRLKRQHNTCFYCAESIDITCHLDHIIPIYYGGTNKSSNLVAACRDCNLIKSTDQIEITNEYTVKEYKKLVMWHEKWMRKVSKNPYLKRYSNKKDRLYHIYRADLFKIVKIKMV